MAESEPTERSLSVLMKTTLKARHIMTPDPICLRTNDDLAFAANMFIEKDISGAPVLDEAGKPVGMITHYDLTYYLGRSTEASDGPDNEVALTLVKDVMTPLIISIKEDEDLHDVLNHMTHNALHRTVVVDGGTGEIEGIISTMDLLRVFKEKMEED